MYLGRLGSMRPKAQRGDGTTIVLGESIRSTPTIQ